jgi:hypothetical protein
MNNAGEIKLNKTKSYHATHHPFDDDTDTRLAGGLLELGQGQNVL